MANQPEVRNDKITVPQRLDRNHVRALALQKAQAKVRKGNTVSDLQLGDSNPVGGNQDPNVEWSYSLPGGTETTGLGRVRIYGPPMRDIETIDAELRLLARAWHVACELTGRTPSTAHLDELLDER